MKKTFTFNLVITIIPSHKIIDVFMRNGTGKNRAGSQKGGMEREKESGRLIEWVKEGWLEMIIAWVGNGYLRNQTPEYFYQCKSIGQTNCQSTGVNLKFFSLPGASTFALMTTCFAKQFFEFIIMIIVSTYQQEINVCSTAFRYQLP